MKARIAKKVLLRLTFSGWKKDGYKMTTIDKAITIVARPAPNPQQWADDMKSIARRILV